MLLASAGGDLTGLATVLAGVLTLAIAGGIFQIWKGHREGPASIEESIGRGAVSAVQALQGSMDRLEAELEASNDDRVALRRDLKLAQAEIGEQKTTISTQNLRLDIQKVQIDEQATQIVRLTTTVAQLTARMESMEKNGG